MYQYNKQGPKRGIALYSYSAEFGISKNLEDCFEDMYDMGAHGLEILANTHIENYPYPSDEWVENWFRLLDKYDIVPVEYGNWIDSHMLGYRDLTTEESCELLVRDIRLAHRLGFTVMRTKMPVISSDSDLVRNFVEFIEETGTKNFGLNIDFGVFRNNFDGEPEHHRTFMGSKPEEIIPLLPYVYCCHAKFNHMNDDFEETTIPYKEVVDIMKEHNWDGYLLSEYEGFDKYDLGYEVGQTLRRHHIMLKRYLGD